MGFLARIELHGARDYTPLHQAMATRGWSQTITSDDRQRYQLPSGTYVSSAYNTLVDAYSSAQAAADETGFGNWVFVARYDASRFKLANA